MSAETTLDDRSAACWLPADIWEHVLRVADFETLLRARLLSKFFSELVTGVLRRRQDPNWNMLLFAQMAVRAGVDYEQNARGSDFYEGMRVMIKRGAKLDLDRSIKLGYRDLGSGLPTPRTFDVGMARAVYTVREGQLGFTTTLYDLESRMPLHLFSDVPVSCYAPCSFRLALEWVREPWQRDRVLMISALPKIVERNPGFYEIRTGDSHVRPELINDSDLNRLWRLTDQEDCRINTAGLVRQFAQPEAHPSTTPSGWVYRTPRESPAKRQRTKK